MDENSVSGLLHQVADNYEPLPLFVDVEAARKAGRRRQWAARASASAGVAAAVAVVAAGAVVIPSHFRAAATAGAASGPAAAVKPSVKKAAASPPVAPKSFNPRVMPATFGWLPAGFSVQAPGDISFVLPTQAQVQAASPSDNRSVDFIVNPWTGASKPPLGPGGTAPTEILGTAPEVNGHPAYWTDSGLAWEYAGGGWAELDALSYLGSDNVPQGWLGPAGALGWTCSRPNVSVPLACTTPPDGPMSAQTKATLEKIASHVQWQQ
jgi:hypothetical protein